MLPEAPSWLLPAVGAIGTLIGLGLFLARMPRDEAAATVALILAVVIWNIARISIWSIISAMLIIVWMMYVLGKEDFRKAGVISGRPLPKRAKWIFLFIVVEAVAGIAHSYFTYVK